MKLEQQQQAQHLYFQTDLSKTEIADHIGISRRSLHYWIKQSQWDRIKQNAVHIPSVLAENCYQLIGGLTAEILSPERAGKPVTSQEASAIYKLTLTINKLKNRGTINENMELFGFFLDKMAHKDPELARKVAPHISSYIHERTANAYNHYHQAMHVRNTSGSRGDGQAEAKEQELDLLDELTWLQQNQTDHPRAPQQPQASAPAQPALRSEPLPKQTQSPATCATSPAPGHRAGVTPLNQYVNPDHPGVPTQLHNPNPKQSAAPPSSANPVRQPAAA